MRSFLTWTCLATLGGGAPSLVHAQTDALSPVPFYHTGKQIHDALIELSKSCAGASMTIEQKTDKTNSKVALDVVTLRSRGNAASLIQQKHSVKKDGSFRKVANKFGDEQLKAMLVFGEHARELISAESGLHFVKALCEDQGQNASSLLQADMQTAAAAVLGFSELKVVVNANPLGRARVEEGDFCWRTNEDAVDLNRNWGEHFDAMPEDGHKETNPGPSAFSEPESRILRDLATDFDPTLFLTVHSGALLLGTPHGYSKSTPPESQEKKMLEVLAPISEKYCDCPYGSLAELVGYEAPGNAIDYVFDDLHAPFSFTWEIYANQELMDYYHWIRKSQKKESIETAAKGPDEESQLAYAFGVEDGQKTAALLQKTAVLKAKQMMETSQGNCFGSYNPSSEDEYQAVLRKWNSAYVELLQNVGHATDLI